MTTQINPSGIIPCGYRVVIRPEAVPEQSKGGIILPEMQLEKENLAQVYGELVAVGPEAWKDSKEPWAKPGDRIIYGKYAGLIFPGNDGVKYRVINDKDIVAVVQRESE